jgi:hypothetical protein
MRERSSTSCKSLCDQGLAAGGGAGGVGGVSAGRSLGGGTAASGLVTGAFEEVGGDIREVPELASGGGPE